MPEGRSDEPSLHDAIARAFDRRLALVEALHASDTDCYRLFHGTVEGRAGLTIDRYGEVLLVQSFHEGLPPEDLATIERFYRDRRPALVDVVHLDRSAPHSRVREDRQDAHDASGETDREIRELGVRYRFRARHRGSDPWLFLDLRAARRLVMGVAKDASVLNLFAYTCGVGIGAAVAGAARVLNVDFAASGLEVGRANAELNGVTDRVAFLESDFFPAVRQLSGQGLAPARRGVRLPRTPIVPAESFDLVFLDPPRYAKSPFGVVDLIQDYGSVFKPSLLATREGGRLVCCNNVARVDVDEWTAALRRGVQKHGRTLRDLEILVPDGDFPTLDGRPPLKVAVLSV